MHNGDFLTNPRFRNDESEFLRRLTPVGTMDYDWADLWGGIRLSSFPAIVFGSGFRRYAFGKSDPICNWSW